MLWKLLFTNNLPQNDFKGYYDLLSIFPIEIYLFCYGFLLMITLINTFIGTPWSVTMNSGYKILTTTMVFHLINCFGEHYGWLPEPKVHTFVLGLDRYIY